MDTIQRGTPEAQEILAKNGIKALVETSIAWDRREGTDWVTFKVGDKDGQEIFQEYFDTIVTPEEAEHDYEYFVEVLESLLKTASSPRVREQSFEFDKAVEEYFQVKKKILAFEAKKEAKTKCEKLAIVGRSRPGPVSGFKFNIALYRENEEAIKNALEQLKALQAEKTNKAQKPQADGGASASEAEAEQAAPQA